MTCEKTDLPDVLLITLDVFGDERGFFKELFHARRYAEFGIRGNFMQDNMSRSRKHILRGLHYQLHHPQAKLISVIRGAIFDVAVDIRKGSPTFGRWVGQELSEANHRQLFIPEGFAHGFLVLSDEADIIYKCSNLYVPSDDRGILWSDPDIHVCWPETDPILSPKDRKHPCLAALAEDALPRYTPQLP